MTEALVCPECGNESPPQPLDGARITCQRTHLHRGKLPVVMVVKS